MKSFAKIILFILLTAVNTLCEIQVSDVDYYKMPDIIQLDDYNKCLAQKDGVFCFGTFTIIEEKSSLFYLIQKYSQNTKNNLNHTQIQRGLCLSKTKSGGCIINKSLSFTESFESCVDDDIRSRYKLRARLTALDYCKSRDNHRKMDHLDYLFIFYVIFIFILNFIGSVYGKMRAGKHWILCFSLQDNWKRLTIIEMAKTNDQKFKSLDGLRCVLAILVMLAHASMTTLYVAANPRFIEQVSRQPESIILFNGSLIVTTFFVITSFLRAYKICCNDKISKSYLKVIVKSIVDRIIRISPLYITVLFYSATLAAFMSDGPVWAKYVEGEADECRKSYWKHLLYLQNFHHLSLCLPQTWYLSTDMHLYVICTGLMTIVVRKSEKPILILFKILFSSLIFIGIIVYVLELESTLFYITPRSVLTLFANHRSYVLLFESVWANFPSAVIGLMAGVLYHRTKTYSLKINNKIFAFFCHLAILGALSYLSMGYFVLHSVTSRFQIVLYSTLDKAGFAIISVFIIFGCLVQKNVCYRNFLEWSGWTILSRLSLASLLVHYTINKAIVASRIYPSTLSNLAIVAEWLATTVLTFLISIPLSLMVEYPFSQLYKYLTTPEEPFSKNFEIKEK